MSDHPPERTERPDHEPRLPQALDPGRSGAPHGPARRRHPGLQRLKRRLQGLALLVVVASLVALSIAIYNKVFTDTVDVTLQAEKIGHQLIVPADVKLNGVIVGEVRSVGTTGDHAVLGLALKPEYVEKIPANVEARILPKTLFGEKFVSLVVPSRPAPEHIKAGDVITQDRSKNAIEIETVFNDLMPMLRAMRPIELSLWLTNMSDALRGQGDALGANFQRAGSYLTEFNKHLPTFLDDVSGLADVANTYGDAAPDFLRMARDFAANARTLVEKRSVFSDALDATTGFADTATAVVRENKELLIRLPAVSRPTLELLARYSPEFPCLINGIDRIAPMLDATFRPAPGSKPGLHIRLEVVEQPQGYTWPGDRPIYDQSVGPNCRGLPTDAVNSSFDNKGAAMTSSLVGIGTVGSDAEVSTIGMLTAPVVGVPSDRIDGDLAALVAGPLMRGMAVSYS